jgi:signal transduction histidine kinase
MAVGLFWLSVPTLVALYDLALPVAFGLSSLQCATLPLAIRFPRSAMLLHIACIVLIGTVTRDSMIDGFWPVPVANLLTLASILILLGLREDWVVGVSAWWLSFLAMTVVVVLNSNALSTESEWGVDVLVSVTVTLIALVVSIFIGQRGRVRETLAAAKRDVELEQARRETVEERARIARELHDVVAHSMSIVHIQAESAQYRVNDLDAARAEFTDIARSARSALGEMRRLLQALHPDDGETLYAPQPTIGDIPALIAGAEKVGSPVTFVSDVRTGALSPVIELTIYRIVQEALSNVIRHAPQSAVEVALREGQDAVEVRVHNSAPPRTDRGDPSPTPSGGHGLRGMRERVALVQGDIEQSLLPDGGFLITARLPTTAQEDTE